MELLSILLYYFSPDGIASLIDIAMSLTGIHKAVAILLLVSAFVFCFNFVTMPFAEIGAFGTFDWDDRIGVRGLKIFSVFLMILIVLFYAVYLLFVPASWPGFRVALMGVIFAPLAGAFVASLFLGFVIGAVMWCVVKIAILIERFRKH